VTNGRITDKVRRDIDDLNQKYKQRGFSQLEIITGMDLLKRFIEVHSVFIPTQLSEFRDFLELILADGREFLNKKSLSKFIETVFFTQKETKPELKRKIASGILLAQYALQPYESVSNHISIIEGWTLFLGYVLSLVEKYGLENEFWRQSYNIVLHKINSQFDLLKDEFFSRENFLEGSWDGGVIYKSRVTIVLGWLSAFELHKKREDSSYILDKRVFDYIYRYHKDTLWYWGESATPFFVAMSLFALEFGDSSFSNTFLANLIAYISSENHLGEGKGVPDPYYSPQEIISCLRFGNQKQQI
jgi:hypothetical protein